MAEIRHIDCVEDIDEVETLHILTVHKHTVHIGSLGGVEEHTPLYVLHEQILEHLAAVLIGSDGI